MKSVKSLKYQVMDPNQVVRLFPIPFPYRISPILGGANNRVYKLEFEKSLPLVLKQYFQDGKDQRPRLHSEFSFLQYAWSIGIRNIPEPYFVSAEANAAIYSYIPARPVTLSDIHDDLVQQKMDFFRRLNERKSEAVHLCKASEACFSPFEYLEITEKRILQLTQPCPETVVENELNTFLIQEMLPKWLQLKTQCKAALHSLPEGALEIENQCISPSDFGFHNALVQNNQLMFIDFEYAGWDDPCKTVCDLFCQSKIPLPMRYFQSIANAVSLCIKDRESFFKRLQIFFPVIQMKWCCILLNAFTKVGKTRRGFSHSDELEHLERQLQLARERLQRILI